MENTFSTEAPETGLLSLSTILGIVAVACSVLFCMCHIAYDRSQGNRQTMPLPAITEDMIRSVNIETIKKVLDQWLVTT
eukprot:scaffold690254_cov122-Attheya_sp.AAC.1